MKDITPFVRQCVYMWIAHNLHHEFTVAHLISDLQHKHRELAELDLCKAISNELIRLERFHKLGSRQGVKGEDGCGQGRPPRVYKRKIIFKSA